jgi:DNA (cytosine-5)-methyltransferase 1
VNYYNEFDPKAAAWLRELIRAGLIPPGDVDQRSITEIQPHNLASYTQCHFFAGIGGWSLALQLAGWDSTRPVWTGSCPCQPFSSAGKQLAQADARHLWPVFFALIRECRPHAVFGEQVASAIGKGWLDGVSSDLEGAGYACGATVLGAHSVGAPHIRQRLYWVANATGGQRKQCLRSCGEDVQRSTDDCTIGWLAHPIGERGCSGTAWVENAGYAGQSMQTSRFERLGFWSEFDIIPCRDGKARRIEPGSFPLAYGVSGRVGLLRGYGNAIVPQVAAQFIQAYLDVTP